MTDLLRASQAAIAAVQDERLRAMLAMCARGHPYYRRVWSEAGIDIAAIRTLADLERLPLTPKQAMMADPERFRLHLPDLPLHERVLWEVIYTTGSTADPTPVYNTTHDYHAYLFQSRRVAEISGIRETDVIANLFPLTPAPMGAFVRSATNAYAAGATIFAALTGAPHGRFDVHRSLDQAVSSVERHRATMLWGVPSFLRRVLLRAIESRADFRSVRMCAITGEASTPAMREELRRCLRELSARGTTVFDRYGSTELGAFAQCTRGGTLAQPGAGDPVSRGGRSGDRAPLARWRARRARRHPPGPARHRTDPLPRRGRVSLDRTPCPVCGRNGERVIGPVVRTKDLVKVKGMLINPAVLLDTLASLPGVDEFQVVVARTDPSDPFSMDEMVVRVATTMPDRDALAATLTTKVQDAVQVRPRIEFAAAASIYDPVDRPKPCAL